MDEADFRQMKAPSVAPFSPKSHFTEPHITQSRLDDLGRLDTYASMRCVGYCAAEILGMPAEVDIFHSLTGWE